MAVVVGDALPLICLSALQQFNLLRLLYGAVLVPTAVWQEVTGIRAFSPVATPQAAADARR